jgi:hypothetical protein
MEPKVSDPMEKGTRPAQTAEPDPLDDPPVQVFGFQGLRGGPVKEAFGCRYPIPAASSIMASFAAKMAPAFFNF